MYEFKLPDLGEGIHEGEILKWHVKAGDSVLEDAPLVDVETDKAAVTIPSPVGGTVVETRGAPGAVVHVGEVFCRIEDGAGAAVAAAAATPEQVRPVPAPAPATAPATAPMAAAAAAPAADVELHAATGTASHAHAGPIPAAPATRRLARELSVDLRDVPASGTGGRVTSDDVQRFADGAAAAPPAPPTAGEAAGDVERVAPPALTGGAGIPLLEIEPLPDFAVMGPIETEALRSIRRKTAKKMVLSASLVPHVCHMDDVDVTDLDELRRRMRETYADHPGGRLTLMPFVMKAIVAGLKAFPKFNASVDPVKQEIVYKKFYNLGFAADTPRGLTVPIVKDVDRKSLLDLSAEIVALASSARDGTIEPSAYQGGTFTVTNIGPLGGRYMTPMINYPEVAILATGRMEERAVVREGRIVVRKILPLSLSFDHRLIDGADAARFIGGVMARLADPSRLLMEG